MKVTVCAKTDKFRRAGMEFTREPREVEVDNKTLKILEAETMLVIVNRKEEKPKDPKDKEK